jgi:hypothetical protein
VSDKQEPTPYHRAAKFSGEREAGAVYFRLQRLIDSPDADLSAYRFRIQGVWHVAVVGDAPAKELAEQLEKVMAAGEPVELTSDALDFLRQRREEQIKHGPWVERHYRPGRRFRFGK